MGKTQDQPTRLEILMDELDRAREAVSDWGAARQRLMNWSCALMLGLLLLSYRTDFTMAALALPFVAIYLLAQYGYLTNLIAHNRIIASALESRINQELGEELLIGESLAAEHISRPDKPGFLGISAANITNLFSATKLHYLVICAVMFLAGAFRSKYILGNEQLRPVKSLADVYFLLLILWALINVAYLVWYYLAADHPKKLAASIRKKFEPKK